MTPTTKQIRVGGKLVEVPVETELQKARELLKCMFWRTCANRLQQYDHQWNATYHAVQDYLIEHGLINATDCVRK